MNDRPAPVPPHFQTRLGRRLTLALALIVLAMLVAGGISLFFGMRLSQINKGLDQEFSHALAADEIHGTFRDIISEIQHIQTTGEFEGLARIRLSRQLLARNIQAFLKFHEGEEATLEESLEEPLVNNLIQFDADLRPLLDRIALKFEGRSYLDAMELRQLREFLDRGAQNAVALHQFHRGRVERMSQGSQRFLRLNVILYLSFLVIGGLLVGLASLSLHRKIAAPLVRLADAALGIAEGRLDERVPVSTQDEMGQLSHAFNVMATRLQGREQELRAARDRLERKVLETEALLQGGIELLGLQDLDTVLRSMVERARGLLNIDAAAILLASPDRETLSVCATSGPPEAFRVAGGSVRLSDSCLASPQNCLECCLAMRPECVRAHLSRPLRRGNDSVGVLCVASREEWAFGPEETEILDALAVQASIAVEHARLDEEARKAAVVGERERLAREMHDGLAQSIGLLHMKLGRARRLVSSGEAPRLLDALDEMTAITEGTYDEIRQSIYSLRTMVSRSRGLVPSLTEFLHEFSERNGIAVKLEADGAETIRLPIGSEVQLIRIVQEALTNIRKHAQASRALVRVEHRDSWVHVSVEDDGRGFDPVKLASPAGFRFGLKGMRERAESLGGKLEIVTAPGRGTRVTALLPLEGTA